jgi:hypothetical protein
MFMRIGLVVAASVFCGAANAGPVGLTGSWAGEMRQIEVSAETTYPMMLTIKGKVAEANYPTLNCSGTWTKVAEKNGYVIYAETVTNQEGAGCIDGMVTVTSNNGQVFLGWFGADAWGPIVAMAVLEQAAAN